MRISSIFLARSRSLGHVEPVPFREILPLKLKPSVSGKGGKISDVCCTYEMSLLFACLKENEFGEGGCAKEIENFQKCYTTHLAEKQKRQEREAKGVLAPGEQRLSPKQVNYLLHKYPNLK